MRGLEEEQPGELIAEDLRRVQEALGEITGCASRAMHCSVNLFQLLHWQMSSAGWVSQIDSGVLGAKLACLESSLDSAGYRGPRHGMASHPIIYRGVAGVNKPFQTSTLEKAFPETKNQLHQG